MAEYIEREALLKRIDGIWDCADMVFEPNDHCCRADDCASCKWRETKNAIRKIAANIPAADVRPVVLCRDCLHYEMGACLKIYDDGAANKDAWQERKPDDYCSYGEDRNVSTNCHADMRPTLMSGANGEER